MHFWVTLLNLPEPLICKIGGEVLVKLFSELVGQLLEPGSFIPDKPGEGGPFLPSLVPLHPLLSHTLVPYHRPPQESALSSHGRSNQAWNGRLCLSVRDLDH